MKSENQVKFLVVVVVLALPLVLFAQSGRENRLARQRTALGLGAANDVTVGSLHAVTNLTATSVTASNLTASLPMFSGSAKELTTKTVAAAKVSLGIQAGSATTAGTGTVTNTFATAFSANPIIVITPAADGLGVVPYVTGVTNTTFLITGATNVLYNWVAIGAP